MGQVCKKYNKTNDIAQVQASDGHIKEIHHNERNDKQHVIGDRYNNAKMTSMLNPSTGINNEPKSVSPGSPNQISLPLGTQQNNHGEFQANSNYSKLNEKSVSPASIGTIKTNNQDFKNHQSKLDILAVADPSQGIFTRTNEDVFNNHEANPLKYPYNSNIQQDLYPQDPTGHPHTHISTDLKPHMSNAEENLHYADGHIHRKHTYTHTPASNNKWLNIVQVKQFAESSINDEYNRPAVARLGSLEEEILRQQLISQTILVQRNNDTPAIPMIPVNIELPDKHHIQYFAAVDTFTRALDTISSQFIVACTTVSRSSGSVYLNRKLIVTLNVPDDLNNDGVQIGRAHV